MPFSPSVQSLIGAHSGGELGVVDWAHSRMFQAQNSYISRYGLVTGTEEAFATVTNYDGSGKNLTPDNPGLRADGGIFISAANTLSAGASYKIPASLTGGTYIAFPDPNFGGGANIGVTYSGTQYNVNTGIGNVVIPVLNRVQEMSATTWLAEQANAETGSVGCAGPADDGSVYLFSNSDGGNFSVLSKIQFNGGGYSSNTEIATIAMADVNAAWTRSFGAYGVCLDQTDDKLLVLFQGVGGTLTDPNGALAKVDPADGTIEWVYLLDNGHGFSPPEGGALFASSDIQHQRIGLFIDGQVTIINTSDGSLVSKYTTGLAGFFTRSGGQCYSDTWGAIVLSTDFTQTGGSPTLLNSTPTSWSNGYCVLYVADRHVTPAPGDDGWFEVSKFISPYTGSNPAPIPPVPVYRITEDGDQRITEDSDTRIAEDYE